MANKIKRPARYDKKARVERCPPWS